MAVLVVEDELDTLEFLAVLLKVYGAKVEAVNSAKEALSVVSRVQPDVLISDICMPDMDGYELIRQLRELPANCGGQVPAIALTAYAGETDQAQVLSAGFNLYLAKPVEPNQIIDAIAHLIQV